MKPTDLDQVQREFERWRSTKHQASDPVPSHLWARAVRAAHAHGVSLTARTLRLNHSALKQRIDRAQDRDGVKDPKPTFVEFPPALIQQPEATLELENPSGLRLRLTLTGATPEHLADVAARLWQGRA